MSSAAAKLGDRVLGLDTHFVLVPSPAGPILTPTPMPFSGKLIDGLSQSVAVDNKPAAVHGSGALNNPPHVPAGGPFQRQPSDRGEVRAASTSVFFGGKAAARTGDIAYTCNDPVDAAVGVVIGDGTVFIGD